MYLVPLLIAVSFSASFLQAGQAGRIDGVHMGPRLLMALAGAVEAVAGAEALAKLVVILHCHEVQEDMVVSDLMSRRFCGLLPSNVLVVPQTRRKGYSYDRVNACFVRQVSFWQGHLLLCRPIHSTALDSVMVHLHTKLFILVLDYTPFRRGDILPAVWCLVTAMCVPNYESLILC